MMLQDLRKKISKKLETGILSPRLLQSRFKVGVDRPVALFNDPTYMPFYYYLGNFFKDTKSLIEFGFDLGMPSGCFMEGCSGVETFLAFKKNNNKYYSKRLGTANIHNILKKQFDLWIGDETDPEFMKLVFSRKWDCAIIADENQDTRTYRAYLDLIWNQMSNDGLIIFDYLTNPDAKEAYDYFCKSHGRESFIIDTVRSTGILQK